MNTQSDTVGHWTLSEEELEDVLEEHRRWVNSDGEKGSRADLSGADLTEVDLTDACLNRADLSDADLTEANLWRAHLRNADLSGTKGLRTQALAQANTTDATLPQPVAGFEGLDRVRNASQYARTLFFTILATCVYSWLAIGTTSDPELIANSATSPLPIIGTDLPIVGFYFVTPLVLLGLYVYFHLQLQRLWEELTMLPSVFPDGQPLDKKADPWLLVGKVRAYFAFLKDKDLPFFSLQKTAVNFVAWWIVPVTIFVFTYAYLPKHDLIGTGFHLLLSIGAMGLGVSFFQKAELTMRGKSRVPFGGQEVWKTWRVFPIIPVLLGTVTWTLFAALGLTWAPGADLKKANLRGANLASTSLQRGQFREANLRDTDLSGAELQHADLSNACLDSADLEGANLKEATLEGTGLRSAVLDSAMLNSAALTGADLAGADLKKARLQNADLQYANFSDTSDNLDNCTNKTNLDPASLRGAELNGANLKRSNLSNARLHESNFKEANLAGAYLEEAYLIKTNLTRAILKSGDLRNVKTLHADLTRANLAKTNLEKADLVETDFVRADLTGARLVGANLFEVDLEAADLRGAYLRGAYLRKVFLRNANLSDASLLGAEVSADSLCTAATLENVRMDDGTTASVCDMCPEKFVAPEEYEVGGPRPCRR